MKECLACNRQYSDAERQCPGCGSAHWVLAPGGSTEIRAAGVDRPEGVRWVGALLLFLGLVVTVIGWEVFDSGFRRSLWPWLLAYAGILAVLGIGLLGLTAWGYWLSLVLFAMDVVLSVVRGFPGGEIGVSRLVGEVVLLVYMAPWYSAFLSEPLEVERAPSSLAGLLGAGKGGSVGWARLGVFAGAWFAGSFVAQLVGSGLQARGVLSNALYAILLTATLSVALRWLEREILAIIVTAIVVTVVHLVLLRYLIAPVSLGSGIQIVAGKHVFYVACHLSTLAMALHALKPEWVAVAVGSVVAGLVAAVAGVFIVALFTPLTVSGIISSTWLGTLGSILTFAAVLTAGVLLPRHGGAGAEVESEPDDVGADRGIDLPTPRPPAPAAPSPPGPWTSASPRL